MLILFDQNVPRRLRKFLAGHQVRVSADLGWERLRNGVLLAAAEDQGYDLVLACDQNIPHQQNLPAQRVALIVLGSNLWPIVGNHLSAIAAAVDAAKPGSYSFIPMPLPPKSKYNPDK